MSEDPTLTVTPPSVNTNLLSIPNASSLQFPNLSIKLDRVNYYAWHRVILSTLEACNLDSYVTESSQTKSEANDATAMQAYLAWRQRDQLILVWLQTTLSELRFNVDTEEYKNIGFTVWDVGGQDKVNFHA
ncbi:hypothetical protein QQ045_007121 [Rhodiola kirilowii]